MMLKTFAAAIALVSIAACQPQGRTLAPTQGDAFLGAADAKVVLVEYGAPTCPACKSWHDQAWRTILDGYIDTNRIKFVWRELPSHNPPVDAAIFGIARCVGGPDFFRVMDEAFVRQMDIERASRSAEGPRAALVSLGSEFGLSAAQVETCISDPALVQRIFEVQEMATADGVNGTPTFLLNDVLIDDPRPASLAARIDAALAAVEGTPAPATPAPTPAAPQ